MAATSTAAARARARVRENLSISFRPEAAGPLLDQRIGEQLPTSDVIRDALRRYFLLLGDSRLRLPEALNVREIAEDVRPHTPLGTHGPLSLASFISNPTQAALVRDLDALQLCALADLCERFLYADDRRNITSDIARFATSEPTIPPQPKRVK